MTRLLEKTALFTNRADAGQRLAEALRHYQGRKDVMVLALPRGGVPVAFEVANALKAPLDLMLVRKLGAPGQEELAMGAIATGGVRVLNTDVIDRLRVSDRILAEVTSRESVELERRQRTYRGDRPPPVLKGRCVILVDDGIATGATMRSAVKAARLQKPARLVVAAPVAAVEVVSELRREADEVVCVFTPEPLVAIGCWYDEFTQASDDEVKDLLARVSRSPC